VHIPKKELPVTKDPIYIKNHAQKLVERSERAKAQARMATSHSARARRVVASGARNDRRLVSSSK
jgi:hypothetical protein